MTFRIWFNRESKNPDEQWVIAPEHGKQILVSGVCLRVYSDLRTDIPACPQAWIECAGHLTMQGSQARIDDTEHF